jgi:hypothetical protein
MNSGGHFYTDDAVMANFSGSSAIGAGIGNNLSCAFASRARRDHLEESTALSDLSCSAARGALGGFLSGSGAGAFALGAVVLAGEFDGFFGAFGDFLKCEFDGGFEIVAPRGTSRSAATAAGAS